VTTLYNADPHPSPTQQPKDHRAERWAWLAVLLSIFVGSIGLVMVGRLRRAIAWIVVHQGWHWAFASSIVFGMRDRWLFHGLLLIFPVIWFARVVDTLRAAQTAPNMKRWYQKWYWYVIAIAINMMFWNAMLQWNRQYLIEVFRVPMRAMADTVFPEDRIIVSKWNPDPHALHRGDIVVFHANAKPDAPLFVMRVVGLPGDRLHMQDRQLYRNGTAVNESDYARYRSAAMNPKLDSFQELVVPPNSYFVLGDNRYLAWDSRRIGSIPFAQHYGKAVYVFWSLFSKMSDEPGNTLVTTGPLRWDRIGLRLD
jgi:signal peptidase I